MRLWSYVIVRDKGLAPNPFWGYCTLALCTPNHQGINADIGDWILGHSDSCTGNKLILLMRVDEKKTFDEYYRDPKYEKKKPVINGTCRQKVGDNMYYLNNKGIYCQHKTKHHKKPQEKTKDLKYSNKKIVFISKHFFYFGRKMISIPERYESLIWKRQSCCGKHDEGIVKHFLDWIHNNYKEGKHGDPRDINKTNKGCR
jgi:hypothetical protein